MMFRSLHDLMRRPAGWPPEERGWPHRGIPAPAEPEWADEGAFLVLRFDLAGIDPRSVQLEVAESSLSLAGHRTHAERTEGPDFSRSSASFGAFVRTLSLPVRVAPRETRARWLDGGKLEIRLRKAGTGM